MAPSDITVRLTELVGPALAGLSPEQQPAIVALAERIAAGRYRAWGKQVGDAGTREALLACASREDEIATRVEATVPDAAEVQQAALAAHPALPDGYAALFAGLSLAEQWALQAEAERVGAATWRNLASADEARSAVYQACAELEETSAAALEALVAAGAAG
ncbi:MAG: hypothetical protein JRH10_00695 [Deltaproteobacteria bacterium]|nr:hypothetical protein [Deltaproteobacteria bacterium]MBW2447224.1 hypothetical protein [Deltaproteobacteria bacterium]